MLSRLTNSTLVLYYCLNNARKRRACQFITDKGRKEKENSQVSDELCVPMEDARLPDTINHIHFCIWFFRSKHLITAAWEWLVHIRVYINFLKAWVGEWFIVHSYLDGAYISVNGFSFNFKMTFSISYLAWPKHVQEIMSIIVFHFFEACH